MNSRNKKFLLAVAALTAASLLFWIFGHSMGPQKLSAAVFYSCNAGQSITAAYYQSPMRSAMNTGQPPVSGGSVLLVLSDGRTFTLPQTLSADGGRYANSDESFVFWNKGNGALVLENNQEKSYIGCIAVAPEPMGKNLSKVYANSGNGFSLRIPSDYKVDEKYRYRERGPGKDIAGIKFTVSPSVATGTNLGSDTYLSVEEIPRAATCSATLFLGQDVRAQEVTEGNTTYSVASSTDAGLGNRYEETVYALPGTSPCVAVRYFVHYSVFENYPPGAVERFDENALYAELDAIRRTLTVVP